MQAFDDRFQAKTGWNSVPRMELLSILSLLGSGHQKKKA
jgi:hypothetical protein